MAISFERLRHPSRGSYLVLVAVVAVAASLVSSTRENQPRVIPMTAQAKTNREYLYRFAQKCRGDFSKLSPEDQEAVREKCGVEFSPKVMRIIYLDPTGEKGVQ